jgi:uncharacterized repeat protein (TIGR03803 family)
MKKAMLVCLALAFAVRPVWSQTESILYNFTGNGGNGDGWTPNGGLVMDSTGNLYGTTIYGGYGDYGTVFELSTPTLSNPFWSESILHNFADDGIDGFSPSGGMVMDGQGNLYGTTLSGGLASDGPASQGPDGPVYESGVGAVFKVAPSGTRAAPAGIETVLYSFSYYTGDGWRPAEGLIIDSSGNLYGTTEEGGTSENDESNAACYGYGCGTVFEIKPSGNETILYNFTGLDGSNPGGSGSRGVRGLTMDAAGNLYGATYSGGKYGYGTVFKLTKPTNGGAWTETVLHSFQNNGIDGLGPLGGLAIDPSGNLYGMTYGGGVFDGGIVFEIAPGGAETILFNFNGNSVSGGTPGLFMDSANNLYGVTSTSAFPDGFIEFPGTGSVFKLAPSNVMTILHNFPYDGSSSDGAGPQGGPFLDSMGNLYGATNAGGPSNSGIVYEIAPFNGGTTTAAPTFSPPPGIYAAPLPVTISDPPSDGSIYYTTNNQIALPPGSGSNPTPYSGPIVLTATTILSAVAGAPGLADSAPVLAEYTIVPAATTTTTTLSSSLNPSVYGQSVTFTAVVAASSGSVTPTGTVQFSVDGVLQGMPVALSGGDASFTTSLLTVVTHSITAAYTPASGSGFNPSSATPLSQVVVQAVLTVTANNANRAVGAPNPAFTVTYSGFANGDTAAVLSGSPALSTTATALSPAGIYPITVMQGTLMAANYTFSFVAGMLSVGPASTTTLVSSLNPSVYGQSVTFTAVVSAPAGSGTPTGTVQLSVDGVPEGLPVTLSGGDASFATSALTAGTHSIAASYTPASGSGFAPSNATPLSQVVGQAVLTVTANNANRAVGAANPEFTVSFSGFVNLDTTAVLSGSPALSTTAEASSPAGTYPIKVAQGTLKATNYTFKFVNGTLSVVQAPTVVLTVTATPLKDVPGGYQAVVTVTNTGTGPASDVDLTSATLGPTVGTPLPQSLGTLAADGGSRTITVMFPYTSGDILATVVEKYAGTYTGGSFGSSQRVTTPCPPIVEGIACVIL